MFNKIFHTLKQNEKCRYIEKIKNFEFDPYLVKLSKNLPTNVSIFEIFNYFINKNSFYSNKQFEAFNSLEAYKFFKSCWIRNIEGDLFEKSNKYIVRGKVSK